MGKESDMIGLAAVAILGILMYRNSESWYEKLLNKGGSGGSVDPGSSGSSIVDTGSIAKDYANFAIDQQNKWYDAFYNYVEGTQSTMNSVTSRFGNLLEKQATYYTGGVAALLDMNYGDFYRFLKGSGQNNKNNNGDTISSTGTWIYPSSTPADTKIHAENPQKLMDAFYSGEVFTTDDGKTMQYIGDNKKTIETYAYTLLAPKKNNQRVSDSYGSSITRKGHKGTGEDTIKIIRKK